MLQNKKVSNSSGGTKRYMGGGVGVKTAIFSDTHFLNNPLSHIHTQALHVNYTPNKYVTRSNCSLEATPKISEQSCFARGLLAQGPVEVFYKHPYIPSNHICLRDC